MIVLLFVLLCAVLIFALKGVVIIKQAEVMIVERLGKYQKTLESGLNYIIPIIESPRPIYWKTVQRNFDGTSYVYFKQRDRIDLRETVYDFPRQSVITKDNVSISINALLYFQIVEPKSALYEIENLPDAIEKLTQTNLRNLVGQLDLDETLVSRDKINNELRAILDEATNKWGVKVNRVELQDIIPPKDIQTAMEKQMKAERDRRAAILEAEGEKKSAILKAEGEKEALINQAEGRKKSAILKAEGEKEALINQAEGAARARIIEADAEKEAIQRIIDSLADKGKPDQYLVAMKYLETMQAITSGQNNKIVYMPYEATGILSSVDGIKEMFNGVKS